MIKKNKKAQFYLVASIILIVLFLSFIFIINYSSKRNNSEIYKYVEELNIEGEWVLDYDSKMGTNEFDNFAKNYSYYVGGNKEIYFLTGTQSGYDAFTFEGEVRTGVNENRVGNDVTLDIDGNDFTFELRPGQNFYFVMTDSYGLQEYFVTNIE